MAIIWKWFCNVVVSVSVVMVVVGDFFRFWYWIKCRKVRECSQYQCRFSSYCHKYVEKITEEDRQRLRELIDRL